MRVSIVLFLSAIHFFALGQDSLTADMLVPGKAIKISPLHLLNFYPTIELSYEHKIHNRITAQFEAGYVLGYSTDRAFQDKRGVKLKLEGRYYISKKPGRRRLYYGAVEPYWHAVNFDRGYSKIECFDAECLNQYIRYYNYKMEYREHGVSFKAGLFKYIFTDFFLDLNAGLTIRSIQYREPPGIVDDFERQKDLFFNFDPDEDDRVMLSPNVGVRLGYRIR